MSKHSIHIGLSGWSFDWGAVIKEKIPASRRIEYLSRYFNSAEANYPFYRLPEIKTYEKWEEQAASGFVFAVKLSRYITHIKRLKGVKAPLRNFLRRYGHLKDKAGPILVQLPANLKADPELLDDFLLKAEDIGRELRMNSLRLAFEFRHPGWFEESGRTEEILARHNACLVFAHSSKYPYPESEPATSRNFVYFRFHGPRELFGSRYGRQELLKWKNKIEHYALKRDVYVFFNNDGHNYSAMDALELKKMIEKR